MGNRFSLFKLIIPSDKGFANHLQTQHLDRGCCVFSHLRYKYRQLEALCAPRWLPTIPTITIVGMARPQGGSCRCSALIEFVFWQAALL